MDRPIIYAGAVPFDTDLLRLGRYAKEGLGRLAEIVFGSETVRASGFSCQLSDKALSVTLGPGTIMAPDLLDRTHIGSSSAGLEADNALIQSLFYSNEAQDLAIPMTGASVTIYALCREMDDLNDVLPFYNADNPEQTMAGPDNRGKALPTRRAGRITFYAGTSAPSVEGGRAVPLYVLSIPEGAENFSAVTARQCAAFQSAMTDLATIEFVQRISQPQALCSTSTLLTVPNWARQVELRVIGGGGGGASTSVLSPEAGSFSGAGGGAGGDCWGVYAVDASRNAQLSATVGAGGDADRRGEPSFVTYGGQPLLTADGGGAGVFGTAQNSYGGSGGGTGGGTLWNQTGSAGSDGQNGPYVFAGNGGAGPWGGGGRAGYLGGMNATRYGAGGGGAYSTRVAGQSVAGGKGYQGLILYRFLP